MLSTTTVEKIQSHVKIRVFIILSMAAQMLLIFWTYKRERTSSQPIRRTLWLVAYLVADFAATVSLGNIFSFQILPETCTENPKNKILLAFWSPFILQHLGRHCKVTAFSLEDNDFWPRHVITFILNEITAVYISIRAFNDARLQYPLALLIISGTLKFGERVFALKHGSMDELRNSAHRDPNPGLVDVHALASKFADRNRRGHHGVVYRLDLEIESSYYHITATMQNKPSFSIDDSVKSLCEAYQNFNKYKGIFTDADLPAYYELTGSPRDRFLQNMSNKECLDCIGMDAKFAYELLYTKSVVSHTIWGWTVQLLSLFSIIFASALYSVVDKDGFSHPDVVITYILVFTALILETVSFVESLTSKRNLVGLALLEGRLFRTLELWIMKLRNLAKLLSTRTTSTSTRACKIGQYSLLAVCFHQRKAWKWLEAVFKYLHLTRIWHNFNHSQFVPVDETLINGILDVLKVKMPELIQGRSASNLGLINWVSSIPMENNSQILRRSIDKGFKECVLIWHIATDILWTVNPESEAVRKAYILSNYMLYLMVVQPASMSSMAVAQLSEYHNACEEGIRFFGHSSIGDCGKESAYRIMKQKYCLMVWNGVREQNSLVQDGCELAAELEGFMESGRGICLFGVWVEFLSFAAISCSGKEHAQLLGTGWQLLTSIWLFMAHCGIPSAKCITNAYATVPASNYQAETVTFEIPAASEQDDIIIVEENMER